MNKITWKQIRKLETIKLYAGDNPNRQGYSDFIGLSINKNDSNHILQDITKSIPLEDSTVDIFVAEDVLEHIYYHKLRFVIDEVYRILKFDSLFRLAVPDYGCDILQNRSIKDKKGQIVFDPGGGGTLKDPGHVWFPRIDTIMQLLVKTKFYTGGEIRPLHYYKVDGTPVMKLIDHSRAPIHRTPDFDERVKNPRRPMSLVIDLIKIGN